jgi:N-acyl-phosphatidylethanolamine-hydrolysing phospholipase D
MNALAIDPKNHIQQHPGYDTRHHVAGGGFQNFPENGPSNPPVLKAAAWMVGRAFRSLQGFDPTPVERIDPAGLRGPAPRNPRTYWLGHASTLIRVGDQIVLTDPVFSKTIGPTRFTGIRRLTENPIEIAELPRVDSVLISHDHYDHLDAEAILELERRFRPWWFVPLGVGAVLEGLGIARVCEMDWWQYLQHGELTFHCLPARHFSGRGLFDRDQTLWASWAITPSRELSRSRGSIFFAGDTGYGPHFKQIRETIGPIDLALLPIGAYLPRWFMQSVHIDPAEAIESLLDLDADRMLAIHWGTFDLADEAIHEPPRELKRMIESRGLDAGRFAVLPVGGSVTR